MRTTAAKYSQLAQLHSFIAITYESNNKHVFDLWKRGADGGRVATETPITAIVIRWLGEPGHESIRDLAGRDSSPVPAGDVLGLELDGRLVAMQSLAERRGVIADPFEIPSQPPTRDAKGASS